jgi:integrase
VARKSLIRIAPRIGQPVATCVKSWRHGFATLLGEGNVDPQIRQIVIGHSLTAKSGLGMTARYSHPSDATIRRQVENAIWVRPVALALGAAFGKEAVS